MKVRPKTKYNERYNPEDMFGYHTERILPSDMATRYTEELRIRQEESFFNDLFDEDIAFEQELANLRKNDPKLDEAYKKFESDYKNEQISDCRPT